MIKRIIIVLLIVANSQFLSWAQSNKKNEKPAENNSMAQTQSGLGVMEFFYDSYNFRNINEKGGLVYHDFKFKNIGKGPLTITDVITACGCTKSAWTKTPVNPGDTGTVRATYDPNGRQGAFDKPLTIITDGTPYSYDIRIKGHVYPTKVNFGDTYKYQYGNLAIKTNSIQFDNVKANSYDSIEIGLFNLSNKKIFLYKIEAPNNMVISQPYDNIPPNTDMKVKLKYQPKLPIEYGPAKQEIKFYTSDDSLPQKKFYVSANIVEDFGVMDKKALKKAPKLVLNSPEIDLGNVKLFSSPVAKFTITNKGKSDLIIRRVIRSCSCLTPELSQTIIPKGKTATLNVVHSLANMAGPDSKTVKIITNDPTQPEITLTIKLNVTE